MTNGTKKLNDLPPTENEFWEDAEVGRFSPVEVKICKTHTKKNWMKHEGYIDNHDGSISCKFCPWGARLPGYMRILDERIFDLRSVKR